MSACTFALLVGFPGPNFPAIPPDKRYGHPDEFKLNLPVLSLDEISDPTGYKGAGTRLDSPFLACLWTCGISPEDGMQSAQAHFSDT